MVRPARWTGTSARGTAQSSPRGDSVKTSSAGARNEQRPKHMYAEKQSDELLLKLNDTRQLWDTWNPKKGDTIAIEDGAAKTGKMFVESVVPESGIVTLRAYSMPQSVKDKRSKAWEKVKFLQLAQEIAGRHGLTLQTFGITDQAYDYVEQNNLPDFAFFQQRCTLEGAAFLVYDGKLVVYDEAYMESQTPSDTITITPASDFQYRDEGANAYGSAEVVNGGLTGTFSAPAGGDKVLHKVKDEHHRHHTRRQRSHRSGRHRGQRVPDPVDQEQDHRAAAQRAGGVGQDRRRCC